MRIGRLIDHPTQAHGADYGRLALELAFELAGESVELIDADAVGSVARVLDGARRLAGDGCALILGPAVTDFAVPLVPLLDELQVPAVNWSGSGLARGAWMFQLKVGSLPDEAGYLTRLLAARSYDRVAVVRDRGPIGDEFGAFVRPGLESVGVAIVADVEITTATDPAATVASLRATTPACVLYLGLGPAGVALCRAVRAAEWNVPVVGNIGLGVLPSADLEGVVFTDVVDERNPVLQRFARAWEARHGALPILLGLGAGHDLAATAIAAGRLAPAPTPAGMRAGLEAIRGLPSAIGAIGTTIGFAPWDRDGYKGPLVVYREISGGRAVTHRL